MNEEKNQMTVPLLCINAYFCQSETNIKNTGTYMTQEITYCDIKAVVFCSCNVGRGLLC